MCVCVCVREVTVIIRRLGRILLVGRSLVGLDGSCLPLSLDNRG